MDEEEETKNNGGGGDGGIWARAGPHWWWAAGTTAQLLCGIRAYRRGYSGDSRFMPFKAFAVASLFVGATASAVVGTLQACGIHQVEDLKEVGANVRTGLGIPPRSTT